MQTDSSDWRERYLERDTQGNKVEQVYERNGEPVVYAYAPRYYPGGSRQVSENVSRLIRKSTITHRPYTKKELWHFIDSYRHRALWVQRKDGTAKVMVNSTEDPAYWFNDFVNLDGSPFGMTIEG